MATEILFKSSVEYMYILSLICFERMDYSEIRSSFRAEHIGDIMYIEGLSGGDSDVNIT